MKNIGQIVKVRAEVPYAQVPNVMLRDSNLSMKAKGLLSFLLSLPSDWIVYKSNLGAYFTDGYTAIAAAWKELEKAGYVASKRVMNDLGHFAGWEHVVYYEPQNTEIGNSDISKADIGKPDIGESGSIQRENFTKKEFTKKEESTPLPPEKSLFPTNAESNTPPIAPGPPSRKLKVTRKAMEFIAPTIDEVKEYFRTSGYSEQAGIKFFQYYENGNPPWSDAKGNPVRSWKQKAQSVWFKDENKVIQTAAPAQRMERGAGYSPRG